MNSTLNPHFRLAGVVGATLFWLAVLAAGALTPGYSHVTQPVSALGAIGAPVRWLINGFGIVPYAVSMVILGVYIVHDLRPGLAAWLSGIALCFAGLGFTLAGLMPCDVGCRPSDLPSAALHNLGAGLGFLLVPTASMILGLRAFRGSPQRPFYVFSFLVAFAVLISFTLFLGVLDPAPTHSWRGVWQRLTLAFITVWIVGVSLRLFRLRVARDRLATDQTRVRGLREI